MTSRIDLKASLRRKVDLSRYSTMQVGGLADYFAEPASEEELQELVEFAQQDKIPVFILGKGSNVIFSDEGYPGLVITTIHLSQNKIAVHSDETHITASAGIHLYRFTLACRDHHLGGAEFLSSIPGTIGGALRMNAGFSRFKGQRNEISDIVQKVEVMDYSGNRTVLERAQLEFSYRHSNLEDRIILSGTFRLWKRPRDVVEKEIRANFRYRNLEQDVRFPSSGSIFKNPKNHEKTAGQLLDQLGLKGTQVGGAMISLQHANYMVNTGKAKSSDFVELIQWVQQKVFDAAGVILEPEVLLV